MIGKRMTEISSTINHGHQPEEVHEQSECEEDGHYNQTTHVKQVREGGVIQQESAK